jgi:hypothetical protein
MPINLPIAYLSVKHRAKTAAEALPWSKTRPAIPHARFDLKTPFMGQTCAKTTLLNLCVTTRLPSSRYLTLLSSSSFPCISTFTFISASHSFLYFPPCPPLNAQPRRPRLFSITMASISPQTNCNPSSSRQNPERSTRVDYALRRGLGG